MGGVTDAEGRGGAKQGLGTGIMLPPYTKNRKMASHQQTAGKARKDSFLDISERTVLPAPRF